ncbi:MAG: HmuY family protein [Bacteroidota bacterium]
MLRTINITFTLLIAALFFVGCTEDEDVMPTAETNPFETVVDGDETTFIFNFAPEIIQFENLEAPFVKEGRGRNAPITGRFRLFDFLSGDTIPFVDSLNMDWDIAFRGTQVLVNGGTQTGLNDEPERTSGVRAFLLRDSLNGQAVDFSTFDLSSIREVTASNFVQDGQTTDADGNPVLAIGSWREKDQDWITTQGPTSRFVPLNQVYFIETRSGDYVVMRFTSTYEGYEFQDEQWEADWQAATDLYNSFEQDSDGNRIDENGNVVSPGDIFPSSSVITFDYAYFDIPE